MQGISFTVEDKVNITLSLDKLGIHYIEGGWPGSNPKDTDFFAKARGLSLSQSKLVAFGSTRRPLVSPEADYNLQLLATSGTSTVTIVGKASLSQVTRVLQVDEEENLLMIHDSIQFLKNRGLEVFFDAEHFFDGFKESAKYALECIRVAFDAGADLVVLCDTNGGSMPDQIKEGVSSVCSVRPSVGIHAHNDSEMAVANSLAAIQAGASQVQGTINGYGERCGNANLCSIIPNLVLKFESECIDPRNLAQLTNVSRLVERIVNVPSNGHLPYVGINAFTHKGGLHASGVSKWEDSYQHVPPKSVGNEKRVIVSELSGKSNLLFKAKEWGLDLSDENATKLLKRVKNLESEGMQYEGAEASFELLCLRSSPNYQSPFRVTNYRIVIEPGQNINADTGIRASKNGASVRLRMFKNNKWHDVPHSESEGVGPVDALSQALRKSLKYYYPDINNVELSDYRVHILDSHHGTSARTRVLTEFRDDETSWWTAGVSFNVVEASLKAMIDGLEYWIYKTNLNRGTSE